jgi:hypothetical protein
VGFVIFFVQTKVVGIDRKKGNKMMSFQELSSRERGNKKSSIAIENIKVMIWLISILTALNCHYFGIVLLVGSVNTVLEIVSNIFS